MPPFGACPAPAQTPPKALFRRTGGPDAPSANLPAVESAIGLRGRTTGPTPPREATRCSLDTLAELDQSTDARRAGNTPPHALTPEQVLTRRARAKYLSLPVAKALRWVRLREQQGHTDCGEAVPVLARQMEQAYRNTLYCSGTLEEAGGRLQGRYCGNRWCLVCNRVRTALSISRYHPVVSSWNAAYLVTLSAPNVPAHRLRAELRRYLDDSTAIARAMKRTHGVRLIALRKLECTYNADADTYHPHFHFVVQGRDAGRLLRKLWLEKRPDASRKAQHITRATPSGLRELFKYFTKLVTRTGKKGATTDTARAQLRVVDAAKLDVIFTAMRQMRVFQPVGFVLPKATDAEAVEVGAEGTTNLPAFVQAEPQEGRRWTWSQGATDWVTDTGEVLAEYTPTDGMRALVESIKADGKAEEALP